MFRQLAFGFESMSEVVTVVDYGRGNLFSVQRALEHCGAQVRLVSDPEELGNAEKLLLPGVGAFRDAMDALSSRGMDQAIRAYAASGKPLFGICLGMQLLLDSSDEFGQSHGLGLIPGKVQAIPTQDGTGASLKVPHIGWSELCLGAERESWAGTLLEGLEPGRSSMYFVHSYMVVPDSVQHRVADCLYGDVAISAVIQRENIWGAQFHPEKSGESGLSILRRFVAL